MPDNTTYLIAALEVGYEPLVEYFRDLAESLGIPDPLPDLPEPPEPPEPSPIGTVES